MAGHARARRCDLGCAGRGPRRRARPGARAGPGRGRPPARRARQRRRLRGRRPSATPPRARAPRPCRTCCWRRTARRPSTSRAPAPRARASTSTAARWTGCAQCAGAGREGDGRRVRGLAARPGRRRHAARDGPPAGDHVHHLGQPDDPDVRPRPWLDRVQQLPRPGQVRYEPGHHLPPQPRAHVDVVGRCRRDHQLVDRRGRRPSRTARRCRHGPRRAAGDGLVVPDLSAVPGAVPVTPTAILDTRGRGRRRAHRLVPEPSRAARCTRARRSPGWCPRVPVPSCCRSPSSSNAPATLAAWSSGAPRPPGQVSTPIGTTTATVVVPLASDGSVGVGHVAGSSEPRGHRHRVRTGQQHASPWPHRSADRRPSRGRPSRVRSRSSPLVARSRRGGRRRAGRAERS